MIEAILYENIISKSRDDLASLDATEDEYNSSSNNSITDGEISLPIGSGNESDDDFPGVFEGPEKTMEVVFRSDKGAIDGLRSLSRNELDILCTKASCSIISCISNGHMDAYVLSESSLFVYKHRLVMKTCGTTTLLRCLGTLLEFADKAGMELTWVGYSRKNLLFPDEQQAPHSSFDDEVKYISTHEQLQNRLRGSGHILGPVTGDHWFVYVADHPNPTMPISNHQNLISNSILNRTNLLANQPQSEQISKSSTPSGERTINMMMFDMDPAVANLFYKKTCRTGKEMTKQAGIDLLCPGAQIDDQAFTPCGYSMNAILHDAYFTMHITPQQECSYASFETNTCLDKYSPLVRNVLKVFRPKRFVLTMFGDLLAMDNLRSSPTDVRSIPLPLYGHYSRTSVSSTQVENDLCCQMAVYSFHPIEVGVGNNKMAVDWANKSNNKAVSNRRERGHSLN
mmetsp:Transcript_5856/g.8137  ORF Transcript_5856/g.8137 Transcript_5856/m.8137 type:complete len:455 (+) Transcript_5856:62-1426(+)